MWLRKFLNVAPIEPAARPGGSSSQPPEHGTSVKENPAVAAQLRNSTSAKTKTEKMNRLREYSMELASFYRLPALHLFPVHLRKDDRYVLEERNYMDGHIQSINSRAPLISASETPPCKRTPTAQLAQIISDAFKDKHKKYLDYPTLGLFPVYTQTATGWVPAEKYYMTVYILRINNRICSLPLCECCSPSLESSENPYFVFPFKSQGTQTDPESTKSEAKPSPAQRYWRQLMESNRLDALQDSLEDAKRAAADSPEPIVSEAPPIVKKRTGKIPTTGAIAAPATAIMKGPKARVAHIADKLEQHFSTLQLIREESLEPGPPMSSDSESNSDAPFKMSPEYYYVKARITRCAATKSKDPGRYFLRINQLPPLDGFLGLVREACDLPSEFKIQMLSVTVKEEETIIIVGDMYCESDWERLIDDMLLGDKMTFMEVFLCSRECGVRKAGGMRWPG